MKDPVSLGEALGEVALTYQARSHRVRRFAVAMRTQANRMHQACLDEGDTLGANYWRGEEQCAATIIGFMDSSDDEQLKAADWDGSAFDGTVR